MRFRGELLTVLGYVQFILLEVKNKLLNCRKLLRCQMKKQTKGDNKMSMEIAKAYGDAAEVAVSNYLRNLSTRQIIMGLMILYFMLCFVTPDIVGHADYTFSNSMNQAGIGSDTSNTGLPWEKPMYTLQRSLTGPIAKAVAMVVVVVAGIFVALGEGGPAGRLVGRLVFGLGLLFGALQIINAFVAG